MKNGRFPLIILGVFLLGIAIAFLFLTGGGEGSILQQIPNSGGDNSVSQNRGPLAVGDTAYDFSLQDLDGNTHTLSDLRGQPVIINFWATWCAPCRIEMPELQAAFERYEDDGLVILALDNDESPDAVRSFFYDEMDLTFTPLLDDGADVSDQYSVFNFPSTYFINAEGKVTAIHLGPMVESQIDGYMANTLPTEG